MMERDGRAGSLSPTGPAEANKENGEVQTPTEAKANSENRDPATANPEPAHDGMP